MIRRQADPAQLEGEALDRWYRRTPAQVADERQLSDQEAYDAFYGDLRTAEPSEAKKQREAPWRQARGPTLAPAVAVPQAPIAPLPPRATSPEPVDGGFFADAMHYPGGLYGGLPFPLDEVTALPRGLFWLGDRTVVDRPELERLYAEQQAHMRGGDGAEAQQRVATVDKVPDGQIPKASDLPKGVRELDPTCPPNGAWERDPGFDKYSERTRRYETQITRAPGLDYVVRVTGRAPVKYDGCAVWMPKHPLLEAKGPGYAGLLPRAMRWNFIASMTEGQRKQAARQRTAAQGRPIEWHIAEPGAVEHFATVTQPDIRVVSTPAR